MTINGSRSELMVEQLRAMQKGMPDIEASALISGDGLILASCLPADIDEDRVAAMSASLHSLCEQIAQELRLGLLDQVFIRGTDGFIGLTSVGTQAVLTVLANRAARPGVVFLEMRRTAEQLLSILV